MPFLPSFSVRSARAARRLSAQPTTFAHTDSGRKQSWWIVRSVALGLALLGASGCAAEAGRAGEEEETPVVAAVALDPSTKIFGGEGDDDPEAASSVVALKVERQSTFELCSGTLVAPNVVLTARHCVANSITTTVACDANGRSTNGEHVSGSQSPSSIAVYVGAAPQFNRKAAAVGRAIVAPEGGSLCDADIALIVLDRPIEDAKPAAVRLGGSVAAGETVRSVGYGQNDKQMPIGTRLRRGGVEVLAMGSGVSRSQTALGAHEFEVGTSICQGDSGGPAISETTGAVVGVVSRGGDCNDDFGHIYTTTAGFSELFDDAFALAGGAPLAEAEADLGTDPAPRSRGLTAASTTETQTESQSCAIARATGASSAGHRPTGGVTLLALVGAVALLRGRGARRALRQAR